MAIVRAWGISSQKIYNLDDISSKSYKKICYDSLMR